MLLVLTQSEELDVTCTFEPAVLCEYHGVVVSGCADHRATQPSHRQTRIVHSRTGDPPIVSFEVVIHESTSQPLWSLHLRSLSGMLQLYAWLSACLSCRLDNHELMVGSYGSTFLHAHGWDLLR